MKRNIKEILGYARGSNYAILFIYLLLIFTGDLFIHGKSGMVISAIRIVFALALSIAIFSGLEKKQNKIHISILNQNILRVFFYVGPFLVMIIYFAVYYPGAISGDNMWQYTQAESGNYNDWHPVLHTILAMKIPQLLTGGWVGAPTFFQIIVYSVIVGYALNVCMDYVGILFSVISYSLIVLNPQSGNIMMFPWKDVAFGMGALLLLSYGLRVYKTNGLWLMKGVNLALLVLAATVTSMMRHNAVLFTIPYIVAVCLLSNWKRSVIVCVSILTLVFSIKYPLYNLLEVERPDRGIIEIMGVPMNIIGAATTYTPELLDEEVLAFAYKVSPEQVWNEKYTIGNYNALKWDVLTDNDVLDDYGIGNVLDLTIRCFKESPKVSTKALLSTIAPVYSISSMGNGNISPVTNNEGTVFEQSINEKSHIRIESMNGFLDKHFYSFLMPLGMIHLLIIITILIQSDLKNKQDYKRILLVSSPLIYNWGTALMLTGSWDAIRFFWYTFNCTPIVLACFNKDNSKYLSIGEV